MCGFGKLMENAKKTCSPGAALPIKTIFDQSTKDYEAKNKVLDKIIHNSTFESISTLRNEVAFMLSFSKKYSEEKNDPKFRFIQEDVAKILNISLPQVKYHNGKAKRESEGKIQENGRPTLLQKSEIKSLIDWICIQKPEPKLREVREFIRSTFNKEGSHKSLVSYLENNDLEIRSATPMEDSRYFCDEKRIKFYFDKLESLTRTNSIPSRFVYNLDEEGNDDYVDATEEKVIVRKGVKGTIYYPVERKQNHATLLGCITASGKALKPLVIAKRKSVEANLILEGVDPTNVMLEPSPTGFINREIFTKWLIEVFIPHVVHSREKYHYEGLGILIMDNCTSHYSEEIQKKLDAVKICIVFLAPHSSHLTQPLDLIIFHSHKQLIRSFAFNGEENSSDYVKKLSKLIASWESATTKHNIMESFKKAGGEYELGGESVTRITFSYENYCKIKQKETTRKQNKEPQMKTEEAMTLLKQRINVEEFNKEYLDKLRATKGGIFSVSIDDKPGSNLIMAFVPVDDPPRDINPAAERKKMMILNEEYSLYAQMTYDQRIDLELESIGLVITNQ